MKQEYSYADCILNLFILPLSLTNVVTKVKLRTVTHLIPVHMG